MINKTSNVVKNKKLLYRISVIVLVIAGIGLFTLSKHPQLTDSPIENESFPHVVALVPQWSGFVSGADQWNFKALLVTASSENLEVRFVEARAENQSVVVAGLEKNEWTMVIYLGKEFTDRLKEHERSWRLLIPDGNSNIRKKAELLLKEIYKKLYALRGSGETEIEGTTVTIPPLPVNPGETVVIKLMFEVRRKHDPTKTWQITAPTSVSHLVLPPEGIPEEMIRRY